MMSCRQFPESSAAGHARRVGFKGRWRLHLFDLADVRARHFGGAPDPPKQQTPAPVKTDAQIQQEAAQARLEAQRRTGKRRTILTSGNESKAPTTAGSLAAPGSSSTIG